MKDILNSTSSCAHTLWMTPTTYEVKIGHSPFKYVAATKGEDQYHRSYILFLGDRSSRGDPQAYKVPTEDFKKWGQWRKVTAVSRDLGRKQFYSDKGNAKKFYTRVGNLLEILKMKIEYRVSSITRVF